MNPIDEAEIKAEIRQMYRDIGFDGCLTVLEENMIFQNLLLDILLEEKSKEEKHGKA